MEGEKNREFLTIYSRLLEIIKSGNEAFLTIHLDPGQVTLMTVLEDGYYRRGLEVQFRFAVGRLAEVGFFLAPLAASYPSYYNRIPGETFWMSCKFSDVAGDDDHAGWLLGKVEEKGVEMRFRDGFAQADLRTADVADFVARAKARKPEWSDYAALIEASEFEYFLGSKPSLGQVREALVCDYNGLGVIFFE